MGRHHGAGHGRKLPVRPHRVVANPWVVAAVAVAGVLAPASNAGASRPAAFTAASAVTASAQHAYVKHDLQRDLDAITVTGVPGVLAEVRTGDWKLRGTSG